MSRRTFDFSTSEKNVLEDMLEELFLLVLEYVKNDSEVDRLLEGKSFEYETPSNYQLLFRCLSREIEKTKYDLKIVNDMLARLREEEVFND
ncbi:MAG: hypothetical protein HDT41_00475 [Lachnospiraceae bacterium]|nr:hypothetical protein [Lachnospiraceae bacterium]